MSQQNIIYLVIKYLKVKTSKNANLTIDSKHLYRNVVVQSDEILNILYNIIDRNEFNIINQNLV